MWNIKVVFTCFCENYTPTHYSVHISIFPKNVLDRLEILSRESCCPALRLNGPSLENQKQVFHIIDISLNWRPNFPFTWHKTKVVRPTYNSSYRIMLCIMQTNFFCTLRVEMHRAVVLLKKGSYLHVKRTLLSTL